MKLYQVVHLRSADGGNFYMPSSYPRSAVKIYVSRSAAIKRAEKYGGTVIECDPIWHELTEVK